MTLNVKKKGELGEEGEKLKENEDENSVEEMEEIIDCNQL